MRIVFLNVTSALGGAERILLDVLTSLRRYERNVDCHLILAEDGPLAQRAHELGVIIHHLPMPDHVLQFGESKLHELNRWSRLFSLLSTSVLCLPEIMTYSSRLRKTLQAISPHVVHSNSLKFHFFSRLARVNGIKVVWHLHDFIGSRLVMRRLLSWASKTASGAIAISLAIKSDVAGVMPNVPVTVIPNAVDLDRFCPGSADGDRLDALAGLPASRSETIRVGLVATYAKWKGQDVFLNAVRQVVHQHPEWPVRFYVIGGPIYRTTGSQWTQQQLRDLAGDLIQQNRVGFIDFQEDTSSIYRSLDVVVHASKRPEPFGLTIAEAMACGRAVVVSSAGGAAELFEDEHDALGVPPGDAAALAKALCSLISSTELRERLGLTARTSAVKRFSRDRLASELLASYEQFPPR